MQAAKKLSHEKGNKLLPQGEKSFFPEGKTLLSFGGNASFLAGKLPLGKKGTPQGGALRKSVSVTAPNNKD